MSASAVAQALALDEVAVSNFSGTGDEFAEFFAVSYTEGAWAVSQLGPPATPQPVTGLAFSGSGSNTTATWTNPSPVSPLIDHWIVRIQPDGQGYPNDYPTVGTPETLVFDSQFVPMGTHPAVVVGVAADGTTVLCTSAPPVDFTVS
jgi:hypothetical protein